MLMPAPTRGRKADEQRGVRARQERGGEDRSERRQRPIDQPDEAGLDVLQHERFFVERPQVCDQFSHGCYYSK